jgi:hypothetical protein
MLEGTHTYRRISAVRSFMIHDPQYRVFQPDAAINPGDSGGPPFVRNGKRYRWIGVTTFGVQPGVVNFSKCREPCEPARSRFLHPETASLGRHITNDLTQRDRLFAELCRCRRWNLSPTIVSSR